MITVVDIGIGNIGSVLKALQSLGAKTMLSKNPEHFNTASKILLPGVGAFGAGMEALRAHGLVQPLRAAALERKVPFLGICMGMQLLAEKGEAHEGLGIVPGARVVELDRAKCKIVPHMGWNNLENSSGNPLLQGLAEKPDFYFVHSFHLVGAPADFQVSYCDYGGPVAATVARGNIFGAQFHPEKSQANGLKFLKNFLDYA